MSNLSVLPDTISVCYIISDIDKAISFEWVAANIDQSRFNLSFVLLNPGGSQLQDWLVAAGYPCTTIRCAGKKSWPAAWRKLYGLLKKLQPKAVHCHLLTANILGLTAARAAGVKMRIYTRHHSSLHHQYQPKGVWWDKLANHLATHIIAISPVVKEILVAWEGVPPAKVYEIPHGFKLADFETVPPERVQNFSKKHGIPPAAFPIVGVIARYTVWKGIQYIIPAFQKLLSKYPSAHLVLLNAAGDFKSEIQKMLLALPAKNYTQIVFESDIPAAYKAMHVFTHVPIDNHSEAFGQIYVEALAASVPSVFTRSGIANDDKFNDDTAWMVPYKNSDAITAAYIGILCHPEKTKVKIQAAKNMVSVFGLKPFIQSLESLYASQA